MIRLVPVRHHRRRYHRNPWSFRRRRNPEVAGTPLGDIVSAGGGAYLTRQISGAASGVAAPVTAMIDGIKSGLGKTVLDGVSAVVVGWFVGKWHRRYGDYARLGGLAIAGNDLVGSFVPGFDAFAGAPSLTSGLAAIGASKKSTTTAALPSGSVQSQL